MTSELIVAKLIYLNCGISPILPKLFAVTHSLFQFIAVPDVVFPIYSPFKGLLWKNLYKFLMYLFTHLVKNKKKYTILQGGETYLM